jgi:hypothetical protein
LYAQGEQDKWEQNEITGNKKRLKIKIQNQNQIQNKKKENKKKTKTKKSQVPCFSMRGMDKKSEARKEKLDTHIFLLLFLSTSYAFTFPPSLPSPFHLALFHKVLCFFSMRHLLWASASPSIFIS